MYNISFPYFFCSLSILITWNWFAVHISWFTRATSLCLTRSLWQCGQPLTTAIAVATLPQLWCSKMWIHGSPNYFVLCLMQSESFHPGPQRPTSSEMPTVSSFSAWSTALSSSFFFIFFSFYFFFYTHIHFFYNTKYAYPFLPLTLDNKEPWEGF